MVYNKKIFENNKILKWVTYISLLIVLIFQFFSINQQYKFLSRTIYTMINDKFEFAIKQYRTLILSNSTSNFEIEFNYRDKEEDNISSNIQIDMKDYNLSFDEIMYMATGFFLSEEDLNINQLDSIYKRTLVDYNLPLDYNLIVYNKESDSIIDEVLKIKRNLFFYKTKLQEIDAKRDVQAYFYNINFYIFKKMFSYIALSILMLIAVAISLIYQFKIIFKQKKIEQIRQDFIDSMIHELRNPLQGVMSLTELVENEVFIKDEVRRNKILTRIKINLKNLDVLLNSILERSFLEQIHPTINLEEGNLEEVFKDIIENTYLSAKKPVFFKTKFIPEINSCKYNQIHLSNAFRNIIDNSIKYSGKSVIIDISTEIKDNFIYIIISDNGFGIDKKDLPYIFTKFYRSSLINKKEGYGLGLSYVKWVIDLHKGAISLCSHKNKGTEFILSIPLISD